ncbi:MAG: tetratricopeptide repeat protein [Chloroflexia bacterium]|nr:tetratricopeptide repeat protein [Chloroflexia bacterium]
MEKQPRLFSFFITALNFIHAKNPKIDSLKSVLQKTENDSVKLNLLNSIFYEYINTDTAEATIYCEKILDEAEKTKYNFEKADAFRIAGIYFGNIYNYEKAIENYEKAKILFKSFNNDAGNIGYAKTLTNVGSLFHRNGDFLTALEIYLEAESILTKYDENTILLKVYNSLADVHLYLNKNEKAMMYMDKAKSLSNLVNDPAVKAEYLISYANNLVYQNKFEEAAKIYETVNLIAEKNNFYRLLSVCAYDYGFMLSRQGNYKDAEVYCLKSAEYARLSGSKFDQCDAMYKVGAANYHMQKFDKANKILLATLKQAEELKSKLLQRNIPWIRRRLRWNLEKMAFKLSLQLLRI